MARSTDRTPDRELLAQTPTFGEYPSDEVISGRLLGRRKFLARGGLAFLGASALGSSLGFPLGFPLGLPLGLPLGPLAASPEGDPKDPYGGFKMGLQSYSLRKFTAPEALNIHFDLDLHWIEFYPGHFPLGMTPYETRQRTKLLKLNDIKIGAYGVVRFTKNHDANRKVFELGKQHGFLSISADPDPDSFGSLEKLVAEYKIPVAIHNHGPGHRYAKIADFEKALKDRHKLIGLCVDTGHFIRSAVDPVEVVKRFKGRVHGVHLKDVKRLEGGKTRFTVLGEGDLDTASLLKELKKQKFDGCLALEYEEEPDDPLASIERCLKTVREVLKAQKG